MPVFLLQEHCLAASNGSQHAAPKGPSRMCAIRRADEKKESHVQACNQLLQGYSLLCWPPWKENFASLLDKLGKEMKITTDKNKRIFPRRSLPHKIFFCPLQKAIGYWILHVKGFWTVKEILAKTTDEAIFSISCMENTSQRFWCVRVEDIFPPL